MNTFQIVIPDTGPLSTLAKLGLLDALLTFKIDSRVVLTDYVEFEVTRHRNDSADAMAIHQLIVDNRSRIDIQKTGLGAAYKALFAINERLAGAPELAKELGVDLEPPDDPGEMVIVQYIRDLTKRPPGMPTLILADDNYLPREVTPLPENVRVVSTRAFMDSHPRIRPNTAS